MRSPTTGRSLGRRLLVRGTFLLLPALGFAALELWIWFLLEHPGSIPRPMLQAVRSYYHRLDLEVAHYSGEIARWDPDLFYLLRPGSHRYENREFSTRFEVNSAGLRDDEASLAAPAIIVLGDSYAMGWGVEEEDTFVAEIERGTGLRTLNAGVSSFGTARELQLLRRLDTSNLQLLIIQYCPNDLAENRRALTGSLWPRTPTESDWRRASRAQRHRLRYWPGKHLVGTLQFWRPPEKRAAPSPSHRPVDATAPADAFLELLAREGLPSNWDVVVFSLEAERVNGGFVDELAETLDLGASRDPRMQQLKRQLVLLDLTGHLDNRNRFTLDPHLDAEGQRQVGRAVLETVAPLLDSQPSSTSGIHGGSLRP